MRAALNMLAQKAPEWVLAHLNPNGLIAMCIALNGSISQTREQTLALREQVGEDVAPVITCISTMQETPEALRKKRRDKLRQVFAQHYEQRGINALARWACGEQ